MSDDPSAEKPPEGGQQLTAPLQEVSCTSCGAMVDLDAHVMSAPCPFCGSATVVRQTHAPYGEPKLIVPFSLTAEQAREAARKWAGTRWPRGVSGPGSHAPRGTYVPALLYSAVSQTRFQVELGYKRKDFASSKTELAFRFLVFLATAGDSRFDWKTVKGARASWVADVLVSASSAISNEALHDLEPYDLSKLERYAPALIAGWTAEVPSRPRSECGDLARGEASTMAGERLPDFMSGERHKELVHETELSEEALDFVLVPVWSFHLDRGPSERPAHIYVNGQTGRVTGEGLPLAKWPTFLAFALFAFGALTVNNAYVPLGISLSAIIVGIVILGSIRAIRDREHTHRPRR